MQLGKDGISYGTLRGIKLFACTFDTF